MIAWRGQSGRCSSRHRSMGMTRAEAHMSDQQVAVRPAWDDLTPLYHCTTLVLCSLPGQPQYVRPDTDDGCWWRVTGDVSRMLWSSEVQVGDLSDVSILPAASGDAFVPSQLNFIYNMTTTTVTPQLSTFVLHQLTGQLSSCDVLIVREWPLAWRSDWGRSMTCQLKSLLATSCYTHILQPVSGMATMTHSY